MRKLKVKNVIISKQIEKNENYEQFEEIVSKKKINVVVADCKNRLNIEQNVWINFLWPDNKSFIIENGLNNNSLVCKFNYKGFSVLFTGDIEKEAEKAILNKYKNNLEILNAKVLKVAHHGSNTSSTKEFIEVVKPKIALIGVQNNNKFGHPNIEVLETLENMRYSNMQNRQNGRNRNNCK